MAETELTPELENAKGHDHEITIYINTREKTVTAQALSFAEIVALAFPTAPYGVNTAYTIAYRRGRGDKPEGILVEGQSVKLKQGMIFDVTATDKS